MEEQSDVGVTTTSAKYCCSRCFKLLRILLVVVAIYLIGFAGWRRYLLLEPSICSSWRGRFAQRSNRAWFRLGTISCKLFSVAVHDFSEGAFFVLFFYDNLFLCRIALFEREELAFSCRTYPSYFHCCAAASMGSVSWV